MKTLAYLFGGSAALVCGFLLMSYCFWADAFCITHLWAWHLAPLGLPVLSMGHAVGIIAIFMAIHGVPSYQDAKGKDYWMKFGLNLLSPWLALFVGWLVR